MSEQARLPLLLIEDDLSLAELTATYLNSHGFDVTHVANGRQVAEQSDDFAVIVCDIMLPDTTGFELINMLTSRWSCPVIYLTALADDKDQIHGLDLGASDYICKPVEPPVLLARIKANLRKQARIAKPVQLVIHDLVLDWQGRAVHLSDERLPMTSQEFSILWVMAQKRGEVLDREFMFREIVGRDYDGLDRAVDLKISRLRKKLEDLGVPGLAIKTIRGQGYLFDYEQ